MLTRRQLLNEAVALPCLIGRGETAPSVRRLVLERGGDDLLAQESAAGFRSVMPAHSIITSLFALQSRKTRMIVLPAVQKLTTRQAALLEHTMENGVWVIWERAASFSDGNASIGKRFSHALGIDIGRVMPVERNLYVRYRWPVDTMVRAFHEVAEVRCSPDEAIAEYQGVPIAMKSARGKGGLIFLGSMLGPGLAAGEAEAHQIAAGFLRSA